MIHLLMLTILVVISSWPVWGWAGEPDCDKGVCEWVTTERLCVDTGDGKCTDWDEYLKGHVTRKHEVVKVSCYERMREAMKAINPYLSKSDDTVSENAVYYTPSTRLRQEAERMDLEDAAVAQFRKTMKDCVEGKP